MYGKRKTENGKRKTENGKPKTQKNTTSLFSCCKHQGLARKIIDTMTTVSLLPHATDCYFCHENFMEETMLMTCVDCQKPSCEDCNYDLYHTVDGVVIGKNGEEDPVPALLACCLCLYHPKEYDSRITECKKKIEELENRQLLEKSLFDQKIAVFNNLKKTNTSPPATVFYHEIEDSWSKTNSDIMNQLLKEKLEG